MNGNCFGEFLTICKSYNLKKYKPTILIPARHPTELYQPTLSAFYRAYDELLK